MSKNDPVLYTFTGAKRADGTPREYLPGVPARSLTERDIELAKRKGTFEAIAASSIYREVKRGGDGEKKTASADKAASAPAGNAADAGQEG